jgi:hypothetical protein
MRSHRKWGFWLSASPALLVWLVLIPRPGHAQTPQAGVTPESAQEDSLGHATIQTWEEELWLSLLDRKDGFGGAFSERGTLKRFTDLIDSKYLLDLLSFRFTPMESYDWYRQGQGFRWRGGSATTLDLASAGEFKAEVPLGGPWNMGVRMDQTSGPRFDGSAVRLRFSRDVGETATAFAGLHLDPHKSGGDVSFGGQWNPGPAKLKAQVTVMDFLNNLLFVTLDAAVHPRGDTTVVYEQQPVALRTSGEVALSDRVRLEAYGTVVLPSSVVVHQRDDRAMGFTTDESVWYAGTMLEWTPTPRLLGAASLTHVRANSTRTANSVAAGVEGYDLVERTTEVEAFVAYRASERWSLSGTAVRMWMPERRDVTGDPSQDVDYLLKAWLTKLDATFTARGGFVGRAGFMSSNTSVPRGLGSMDVTGLLDDEFYRMLMNFGWTFGNAIFVIGGAYDYHPRTTTWIWGTSSSRIIVRW